MDNNIQLFENQPIRAAWIEDEEEWYFSIVDVVKVLTEQADIDGARNYWKVLKNRIKAEGNELVTNCNQLKMTAQDGKKRLTDVANTEQLLRIIQSIPSKKAEPFKMWLAQVGRERIEETIDPELTIDRALETYSKLGYDADWINQRLQTIRARKELTDQWKAHSYVEKMKRIGLDPKNFEEWYELEGRKKRFAGTVHGCIIDIDTLNHIHIDPQTGKVQAYNAVSKYNRNNYQNLPSLLAANRPEMLQGYVDRIKTENALMVIENGGDTSIAVNDFDLAISDEFEKVYSTDMYDISDKLVRLQLIYDFNLVTVWNDDLLMQNKLNG